MEENNEAEAMSSSDIDRLLSSLSAANEGIEISSEEAHEEPQKPRIRLYDFKRPDTVSKADLKVLSRIFAEFASLVSERLSRMTRLPVKASCGSVDTLILEEYLRACPEKEVFCFAGLPDSCTVPDGGLSAVVLGFPSGFASGLIRSSLGCGIGDISRDSDFSPLERQILASAFSSVVVSSLSEAFFPEADRSFGYRGSSLVRVYPGTEAFPDAERGDSVLIATLLLALPAETRLNVVLPALCVPSLLGGKDDSLRRESAVTDSVFLSQELRFFAGKLGVSELRGMAETKRWDIDPWKTGRRSVSEEE
jgi:hypothetical protein